MAMSSELQIILDAYKTPSPFGEKGPNDMETIAIAAHDPGDKFKHVVVNMRGINGNTLVILGHVKKHLKRAGATPMELYLFMGNALAHDYEHALATVCQWVSITDVDPEPTRDAFQAFIDTALESKERLT
jgi:hypothetical protein